MSKKQSPIERATEVMAEVPNSIVDVFDKVASPASRAGSTVERVGKMCEANVSKKVIALQMTENSKRGHKYTEAQIEGILQVYQDSKSAVCITKKQAHALTKNQKESDESNVTYPTGATA